MGKFAALAWSRLMYRASGPHLPVAEKDAAAVRPGFEGVLLNDVLFPHLAIADAEVPGDAVDVDGVDIKRRAGYSVTAIAWAVAAV
jgi:hypothetical protein